MPRGVLLPRRGVEDARTVAVECETLGYDACWTGELWGRDAFVALTAVAPDPDRARAAVRRHLAYYVGSGEGYRRAVATVFPDATVRVADAWAADERDAARAAVTDEMVDALGVAGTPETARERFEAVASLDTVDHPSVVVPDGASEATTGRTIEALAPA